MRYMRQSIAVVLTYILIAFESQMSVYAESLVLDNVSESEISADLVETRAAANVLQVNTEYGNEIINESEIVAEGTCGGDLTWILDTEGVLKITGTGEMSNYRLGNYVPWYSNRTSIKSIVLDNRITSIGDCAFSGCSELTGELIIPDGIRHIGKNAFVGCSGLTGDLVIPNSVLSIGDFAFSRCSGLNGNLYISDSVTVIGQCAFAYCNGLTGDLIIPDSVTSVGNEAFYDCSGFDGELILSENMTKISSYTFYGCSGLNGLLVIPDNITKIEYMAFYNCKLISELVLGSGLQQIGKDDSNSIYESPFRFMSGVKTVTFKGITAPVATTNIFYDMSALEYVYVPEEAYATYTSMYDDYIPANARLLPNRNRADEFLIEEDVLLAYFGDGGDVVIPDGIKAIGNSAFVNCTNVNSISMPESIVSIGKYAFKGCSGLSGDLVIPDSVVAIGNYAFSGCSGMTGELAISRNTTTIGDYAFSGCKGLTGDLIIPDTVTTIGNYAFTGCSRLTGELIVPDSVYSIGAGAFYNCSSISSVVIGNGLTTLGLSGYNSPFGGMISVAKVTFNSPTVPTAYANTFAGMYALETIYVPEEAYASYAETYASYIPSSVQLMSVEPEVEFIIEDSVLVSYTGEGGEVVIPEGVVTIGDKAFQDCTTITKVTIPNTVISIGNYAFSGCTGLTGELVIPESVTKIGSYSFQGCNNLTGDLIIPDSVTSLGSYAFHGCSNMNGILRISNNIKSISSYCFFGCSSLTGDLIIPDSVTSIGTSAFQSCISLDGELFISDSVTSIGEKAFSYCSSLKGDIDLPEKLTTIERDVFFECSGFDGSLTIPDGVKKIGMTAFKNCSNLTGSLIIPDSVTDIGTMAFYNCNKLTGDLIIPDGVRYLSSSVFHGCSGFDGELILSSNLTGIPSRAFQGCRNLKGELNIPDQVTIVANEAFYYCESFTSIVFGESVSTLGNSKYSPFLGMSGVKTVTFENITVPTIYKTPFSGMNLLEKVYLPSESYGDYANVLKTYIPSTARFYSAGITTEFQIEDDELISYTGSGGDVVIPETIESISTSAFQNCINITSVSIPNNVASIGEYAFSGCEGITGELVIPDSVTSISSYAFNNANSVSHLILGNGLTEIGSNAFAKMGNVTEVTFKGLTVPTVVSNPFTGMKILNTINVPEKSKDAYIEVFGEYVGESVEFVSIPSEEIVQAEIVKQPESQVVLLNQNAVFTVDATGGDLRYQWQYSNNGIYWYTSGMEGASTNCITVAAISKRDGQQYRCIITDSNGVELISDVVTLTLVIPEITLSIIKQPENKNVSNGQTAEFTVEVEGEGLSYQWQFSKSSGKYWMNSGMEGADTNNLSVPAITSRNGQVYRCVITDENGTKVTSDTVTLIVESAETELVITKQPESYFAKEGTDVAFTVEVDGDGLSYKWQYSSDDGKYWHTSGMAGADTNSVTVCALAKRDGQMYRCVITDENGTKKISDVATLIIDDNALGINIITQPQSQNVKIGTAATFTIEAEGEGISYQWQYSSNNGKYWFDSGMSGAKTNTLTVDALAKRDGQMYRCVVVDDHGNEVVSEIVVLDVN